jgi:hypothetical protein
MPPWFHKRPSPFQTPLAMIGAKPGGRVLFIGAADPDLAAQIALVTGLNGVTFVTDSTPGVEALVNAAAGAAGALVECGAAPPAPDGQADAFDAAVLVRLASRDDQAQRAAVAQGLAHLRSGGRLLVLEGRRQTGLLQAFQPNVAMLPEPQVLGLMRAAGAVASRSIGEADGVKYYECRKA